MLVSSSSATYPEPGTFERAPGFPYWTMGVLIRGNVSVTTDEGTYEILPRFLGATEANTTYSCSYDSGMQERYCFFVPDKTCAGIIRTWPSPATKRYHVEIARSRHWLEIQQLFRMLPSLSGSDDQSTRMLAENTLQRIILLANSAQREIANPPLDERVMQTVSYMEDTFREPLSLATLAEATNTSPSRLAHLFRDRVGEPPMTFLHRVRIREAERLLLTTNMLIKEIAEDVGYPNPYHFSTVFRRYTGQSPRDFRFRPRLPEVSRLPRSPHVS